jgi:hypothetical protein
MQTMKQEASLLSLALLQSITAEVYIGGNANHNFEFKHKSIS